MVDKLSDLLDKIPNKPCVILGDFNLNLFNFDTDNGVASYSELFFSHGYAPLISKPTHIRSTSTTLIDNIWTCSPVDDGFWQ